jgi:transposase
MSEYELIRQKIKRNKVLIESEKHLLSPPVQAAIDETFSILDFLINKVEYLEQRINKTSKNSHLPPSLDKKPVKKRIRTELPSGGIFGHKGKTLNQVSDPNLIIHHPLEIKTCICGSDLTNSKVLPPRKAQVFDIEFKVFVTEHVLEKRKCLCGVCHEASPFVLPLAPVQYGKTVQSFVSYLHAYQHIPFLRIKEMFNDLFKLPMSEGTVNNMLNRSFDELNDFEEIAKVALIKSKTIYLDETPIKIDKKKEYVHTTSTPHITLLSHHQSRGRIAVDDIGVLKDHKGEKVHDFYSMYFRYGDKHVTCNAHLLRELEFAHVIVKQVWAKEMIDFLLNMKKRVDEAKKIGTALGFIEVCESKEQYRSIIRRGVVEVSKLINNNGKGAQDPVVNLLDRIQRYQDNGIKFIEDFEIDFTNNLAERDLRMNKVHQKISGGFRTSHGAKIFCRLRSFISTLKKQKRSVLAGLNDVLNPNSTIVHELLGSEA